MLCAASVSSVSAALFSSASSAVTAGSSSSFSISFKDCFGGTSADASADCSELSSAAISSACFCISSASSASICSRSFSCRLLYNAVVPTAAKAISSPAITYCLYPKKPFFFIISHHPLFIFNHSVSTSRMVYTIIFLFLSYKLPACPITAPL